MMVTALAARPGRPPATLRQKAGPATSGPALRPDLGALRLDLQQETNVLRGELLEAETRLQAELQIEAQAIRRDLAATGRDLERAVDRMVWKLTGLMTAEALAAYALVRLLL